MAELKNLPNDIYDLFNPANDHEVNEENVEWAGEEFKELLRTRLRERQGNSPWRMSSLGKKDRQFWYAAKEADAEAMSPKTYFKFLYGDVIELLILFLAREAGHTVERTQEEIEVNGITGHIDAIVDGVVVDVKSAAPYSFQKFKKNAVLEDDPFGYVQQLSSYATVLTPNEDAAWLAFDKVAGDICVTPLSASIIADHDPAARIEHLREIAARDEPPERCYEDEEDGKSGNRKLGTGCSYCAYKQECWPGLRTFLYSGKPRFLTKVGRVPDVPELTNPNDVDDDVLDAS
jgi:hypothetical protein